MKIESINPRHAKSTLKVFNEDIEFDENNTVEVEESFGKRMIENFSSFFEEGKVPKKEKKQEPKNEVNPDLEALKTKNKELEDKIKELQDSKSADKTEISEDDISLIIEIASQRKTELEETCEKMELPKDEWETKKHKELAIYLIKKTL